MKQNLVLKGRSRIRSTSISFEKSLVMVFSRSQRSNANLTYYDNIMMTFTVLNCVYILTYRNNPSYTSMGILIFLSVRSNTDQIRMKLRLFQAHLMCSRNRVLTYSWSS